MWRKSLGRSQPPGSVKSTTVSAGSPTARMTSSNATCTLRQRCASTMALMESARLRPASLKTLISTSWKGNSLPLVQPTSNFSWLTVGTTSFRWRRKWQMEFWGVLAAELRNIWSSRTAALSTVSGQCEASWSKTETRRFTLTGAPTMASCTRSKSVTTSRFGISLISWPRN